jgi:hypothetical protein
MREKGAKKGQGSARPNAEATPRRSPGNGAARASPVMSPTVSVGTPSKGEALLVAPGSRQPPEHPMAGHTLAPGRSCW